MAVGAHISLHASLWDGAVLDWEERSLFLVGRYRLELQVWDFGGTVVGMVPLQPEGTAALRPMRSLPKTVTGFVVILCPEMSLGQSEAVRVQLGNEQGPVEGGALTLDLCCFFRLLSASGYTVSN